MPKHWSIQNRDWAWFCQIFLGCHTDIILKQFDILNTIPMSWNSAREYHWTFAFVRSKFQIKVNVQPKASKILSIFNLLSSHMSSQTQTVFAGTVEMCNHFVLKTKSPVSWKRHHPCVLKMALPLCPENGITPECPEIDSWYRPFNMKMVEYLCWGSRITCCDTCTNLWPSARSTQYLPSYYTWLWYKDLSVYVLYALTIV